MSQPNFKERTENLRDAAQQLRSIADIVLAEAQRMDAARARFAERRTPGTRKAGR
jgi:hypothetical protein